MHFYEYDTFAVHRGSPTTLLPAVDSEVRSPGRLKLALFRLSNPLVPPDSTDAAVVDPVPPTFLVVASRGDKDKASRPRVVLLAAFFSFAASAACPSSTIAAWLAW